LLRRTFSSSNARSTIGQLVEADPSLEALLLAELTEQLLIFKAT